MIHLLTEIWQSSSTKILASPPHIQTIDMRNIFVEANGELLQNGDFEVQIILTANARASDNLNTRLRGAIAKQFAGGEDSLKTTVRTVRLDD